MCVEPLEHALSEQIAHLVHRRQVSQFLEDHPGGDDLILNWAGKDITEVMQDPIEHSHSDSAYQVLDEYQIGRLGQEECITNPDFEFTDDWHPDDTDNAKDWERNQFLDLNRPLIMQVWNSDFSKAFYLQQVHQPRCISRVGQSMRGESFADLCIAGTCPAPPVSSALGTLRSSP